MRIFVSLPLSLLFAVRWVTIARSVNVARHFIMSEQRAHNVIYFDRNYSLCVSIYYFTFVIYRDRVQANADRTRRGLPVIGVWLVGWRQYMRPCEILQTDASENIGIKVMAFKLIKVFVCVAAACLMFIVQMVQTI